MAGERSAAAGHRPDVQEISDRYVEETARLDPLTATYLGIRGYDDRMTDFGPDGWAARAESARSAVTAVTGAETGSDRDRIAAEQLRERLQVQLDLYDAGYVDADLNTAESPPHRAGARTGRVSARSQVLGCAERASGYAAANAAFSSFADYLREDLLPHAPATDAVGPERYALASRTGTALDLRETYDWGWEELAGIESEMRQTARELGCGDDIGAAIAALDADPARQLRGADALQRWLQDTSDAALSALLDVHFDIPEPVRVLECRICPTSGDGIYCTGPSEDFSRPGRMWWSLPVGAEVHSTWREKTTVFHEGVPGHHLQIGQTAYRSEQLNRFQRLLCFVSGHGEGWALYAERLMAELEIPRGARACTGAGAGTVVQGR